MHNYIPNLVELARCSKLGDWQSQMTCHRDQFWSTAQYMWICAAVSQIVYLLSSLTTMNLWQAKKISRLMETKSSWWLVGGFRCSVHNCSQTVLLLHLLRLTMGHTCCLLTNIRAIIIVSWFDYCDDFCAINAVSYTHLTLPTILRV